jgi:FtsP/CotA-like multicopper oxidase with cupredoxin domain
MMGHDCTRDFQPMDIQADPIRGSGAEVVYELEAGPVKWTLASGAALDGWGYNGQVPGPVLEANAGDTLVVRLKNSLPEPTTIHWHGIRLPAQMDGTEQTQVAIQPGETFEYRFVVPDAGTFWYHPHANEVVQLERGLYGALIVRGQGEPMFDRERVLVLDDLKLDRKGAIAGNGGFRERHNGREGKTRLINGRQEPEFLVAAGQTERWRVVNASSARYVRLSIGGLPFSIIGTDGGLIERPYTTNEVLIAPGDRVDVAVGPFEWEGQIIAIDSLAYQRGAGKSKTERFGTIRVGRAQDSTASLPLSLRKIELLAGVNHPVNRTVVLSGKISLRRGVDFMVNGEMHHHAEPVRVGELQVWDVENVSMMDHPFHLHGFFFQVLLINGEPPAYRSWEDTVNVSARGSVRIAWIADDRPGEWMYHCHILEHHAAGMMAHFRVVR